MAVCIDCGFPNTCIPQLSCFSLQAAVFMTMTAAVLFSSNALHVVATRAQPRALLALTGCAALDISAVWMTMSAACRSPCRDNFPLLSLLVCATCDISLASVIAKYAPLAKALYPTLLCRALLNTVRLSRASSLIVQRDEKRKQLEKLE